MTNKELSDEIRGIHEDGFNLINRLHKLIGVPSEKGGILTVYGYEANRRLEEFMHRVGDCAAFMSQRTEEALAKVVQDKIESGNVITFPEGAKQ